MKKFFAVLLTVVMCLGICAVANAEAPQNDKFTAEIIYSMEDKTDVAFENETDGWFFNPEPAAADMVVNFKDQKMVISDHYNGYLQLRVNMSDEAKAALTPEKCAEFDAIGFYFENNTAEECGLAFFGENERGDKGHQNAYQSTEFSDITTYLVDMDGNITKGKEYLDDYGHGCAAVPAGFKGYFMVTMDTLGHDYCSYGEWGFHPDFDCEGGKWVKGESKLVNVGVSIYSLWSDEGETFVVDDYMFVKFGENFSADETPNDKPTEQTTQDGTASSGATTAPTATQGGEQTTNNFPWVIVIVAGVVVVAAVVVIAIVVYKKKKVK